MMFNRIIRFGFMGLILGCLSAVILSQWIWLEMRVNVGLLIPAGTLIGAVTGVFFRGNSRVWGLFVPELFLAGTMAVIYGGDLGALTVIPAVLLREGLFFPELSLQNINIILVLILIVGNLYWLLNSQNNIKGPNAITNEKTNIANPEE